MSIFSFFLYENKNNRLKKSSQQKILPKSPVPPLITPPKEYKTYSPNHFDPPHEHLDEVREERFYLSQVKIKNKKKISVLFFSILLRLFYLK